MELGPIFLAESRGKERCQEQFRLKSDAFYFFKLGLV